MATDLLPAVLDAFDLFLNEDEQRVMHGRFATFKVNTVDKLCGMGLSTLLGIFKSANVDTAKIT